MSETVRAFIAVDIPTSPELERVQRQFAKMGRGLKPVARESLHLTLSFLGEMHGEWIPNVLDALDSAVRGRSAFTMRIVGLGAFPRIERPSVVWAGLHDAEPLIEIADVLETELRSMGFAADPKPFHPHVTLARVRNRPTAELAALFTEHETTDFGQVQVNDVRLFSSELRPEGPKYTVLRVAELTSQ